MPVLKQLLVRLNGNYVFCSETDLSAWKQIYPLAGFTACSEDSLPPRKLHDVLGSFTACSEGHILSFFNSFLIMPKAGMLGKLFVIRRAARIGRVVWMAGGFGGGRTRFKLWGVIKGTMNGTVNGALITR